MNEKFIYVFSEEKRDELLARGCVLLYSDDAAKKYVFASDNTQMFSLDRDVIVGNTLTF